MNNRRIFGIGLILVTATAVLLGQADSQSTNRGRFDGDLMLGTTSVTSAGDYPKTDEVRPDEIVTTTISARSWKRFESDLRNMINSPVRSDIKDLNVDGFPGVSFVADIEGKQQTVIALDLGYRTLLVASTDTSRTLDEMQALAKGWLEEAMRAEIGTEAVIACNCVLWARSQTTSLPTGMTTYTEKLSKRNHLFPTVGSNPNSGVAIIQVTNSQYGHVAVNRAVTVQSDGSLSLRVQEANWSPCAITYRTGTMEALKVQGFYDPRYASGDTYPRISSPTSISGPAGTQFWISIAGSGFQSASMRAVILGGSYCTTFDRCQVPTNVITNRTSTTARIPVTLGTGNYRLYIFNSSQGKTSNGIPVHVP
jgi:hypothetical protein